MARTRRNGEWDASQRRVDWEGIESFCPLLRAYFGHRCRDENEAEDLLQETLIKAARSQWGVKDRTRMRGWILRVGSNVLRDHIRKVQRGVVTCNDDGALDLAMAKEVDPCACNPDLIYDLGEDSVEGDVLLHSLSLVYGKLRAQDRSLLNSYYGGAEDTAATAEELRIQRSVVKVRLFRARKRLGKALRRDLRERHGQRLLVEN
ncbi:MAG: RNA polymerase sigma factor [Planctomycetota bacterium]|nr:RNA polymerase sigma factor [Planctomycetota bacterium]MDP6938513.1 RNA polymerase sigma factor [Planctomycetota bacterium]